MQTYRLVFLLITTALSCGVAAEPPHLQISSASFRAAIYPPDAANRHYRAMLLGWAGVFANLGWGHGYFGKWYDRYDPKTHDAIMGRRIEPNHLADRL
jgi:hypothetical protein